MRLAVLLLLLAVPARAQQVVDVRTATLLDAVGRTHSVTGGYWLDDTQGERVAKELVALRAENTALREAPAAPPLWVLVVAVGVGLAGGVALGMAVR